MTIAMDPPGILAAGNVRLWWVTSLAAAAQPTAADLAAGVELSLAAYDFRPVTEQPRSQYALWLGGAVEQLQPPRYTINDIEYDYQPQLLTDPGYPYGQLVPDTEGWLVERRGLAGNVGLASGQVVDMYPVTLGHRHRVPVDPSADGEMLRVRQPVAVRGQALLDVTLT